MGQAFIENAMLGKDLTVNGDGNDSLDFTYIEDLVQGVILSITNKNSLGEIFNITYGSARKINQLAQIVIDNFEGVELKYNPRDSLMPERGTLSIKKAQELLGYNPTYPIEKGFLNYIKWYKNFAKQNPNFFAYEKLNSQ